ncbi:uncharacterized protein [Primulina huaijiensis]|uniref:uncharacterized protein n=1 Tax=Primulina huaijiensis TaxID=1492673 RepID=UPI003CC6E542
MALSHLLQPKSSLPICLKRFSTRKVCFYSSFFSTSDSGGTPQLKNDAAAEENRDMTVEPLVNESAHTKPDIVSRASGKEKGAPWYILKDVVDILKDKMLGNNQPQNYYAIDASTHMDCTASVVIPSSNVLVHGSGELQDSEATTKLQNDFIFNDEEVNVDHGKSCMAGEVYEEQVNGTTSEVNQMLNFPQAAENVDKDAFNTTRMRMSPGISSLSSGENYCEEAARLNNSKLVSKEAEFLKSDEVSSPIFLDLEVDLVSNPENSSSLQPLTISVNSTERVNVEKNEIIIDNVSVDFWSERGAFSGIFDGPKKSIRLVDLFQKKNHDQTSPEAIIEQTDPEETLSDLLLKFERKRVSQFKHSSPADDLSPDAATSDSEADKFKEISLIGRENKLQEDKNVRFEGDQNSSPSKGTQNIFDLTDLDTKSVSDQIVDENFKPRSLTFTQFEHSNEHCEVDAEKLSDIKDLIDFIKLQEGVPYTSTNDNSDTGRITENPSNSNSQRPIYDDLLTASDSATEKSKLENQKINGMHFESLGGTELKATFDFLNPTMKIDEEKLRNSVSSESLNSDSQNLVDSKRLNSTDFTTVKYRIEDEERVDLDFGSLSCTELKAGMEVPNPTENVDREKLENTFLSSKESNDNRVVVKLLRKAATVEHIIETFKRCGTISNIEILDVEGPLFKTAYIHFETRKGFQRAIGQIDMLGRHGVVTVKSATSNKNVTVPVPNLIGDPNVPTVLIKNPSRTVKIKPLTPAVRLHHIEEALSFCDSNVSGYFLGVKNSVGFIEFETEIGKERALVKHSINVLGKQLAVLRIDVPRTTVVRVSYIDSIPHENIMSVCSSFGKVRVPIIRCPGILDVHYKLTEWPNMWNILNRLNGVQIEGRRLRAEPAPVFPTDILSALWHQPKERKGVKKTALALLEKLRKNMRGTAELDSLEQLFEDRF